MREESSNKEMIESLALAIMRGVAFFTFIILYAHYYGLL